jgi:integrase
MKYHIIIIKTVGLMVGLKMGTRFGLSAITAKQKIKPGKYADGVNGLYLQITQTGIKSWIFRYTRHGKRREMGLGAYPLVSLSEAREEAAQLYKQVRTNPLYDPIADRAKESRQQKLEHQKEVSFKWCAEQYIDAKKAEWANAKHCQQWTNTLTTYVFPFIGDYPVKEIDTALVMQVLTPIWSKKNETAGRVRGRIENILSWAAVQKYRSTDNPAQWKGHLENLLPKSSKIRKVEHHKALPYSEINTFITALHQYDCMSAYALEFLILTASRTNEVIGARWGEIDFSSNIWTIPAERMKAKKEHSIPLSDRALAIVKQMYAVRTSDYIFQGGRTGKGLSNAAMDKLLQTTMGYDCTVHGFRSTFRDWAGEQTNYANEVCEMALAHTIKNKAEAAYRRGDLLEKRLRLMNDWKTFCNTKRELSNNVHPAKNRA